MSWGFFRWLKDMLDTNFSESRVNHQILGVESVRPPPRFRGSARMNYISKHSLRCHAFEVMFLT